MLKNIRMEQGNRRPTADARGSTTAAAAPPCTTTADDAGAAADGTAAGVGEPSQAFSPQILNRIY